VSDMDKTKEQLVSELAEVRERLKELQASETERKRAEEALRESEERFRRLVEQAADAFFVFDSRARIIDANRRACDSLGYTREELLSLSVPDVEEGLVPEGVAQLEQQIRPDRPITLDGIHRRKDGTTFPVESRLGYLELGERELMLALVRDVTERKRAEKALRRYAAELEARNEELDAFAHTTAHDLKGPLGPVVGFAYVLAEDYAALPQEDVRRYLRTIAQNGRKMSNIIDELLLLASLRKMREVALGPLDMASIVAEVQERLCYMIEQHQAEVIWPESWPVALGYAPWVEEVWVNYLSNAIKYGGRPPRVELGATAQAEGAVRFWVRDNGRGLTSEQQARLFTPFERLDRLRAKGHGLGLSIVQRIVGRLGGKVGVESQVGRGSLFFFTLPARRNGNGSAIPTGNSSLRHTRYNDESY
jgi:PAS domain S-box-containing protein